MNGLQSPSRNLFTQCLTMPVRAAIFLTVFLYFHPSLLFLSRKKQTGLLAAAENHIWRKTREAWIFPKNMILEESTTQTKCQVYSLSVKKKLFYASHFDLSQHLSNSASADIMNSCWLHSNVKSALHCCWSSSTSQGSQMHTFTATRAAWSCSAYSLT